ncbi:hypothetical protein WR25_19345 [Diploscapter pachys]|uniref:Nematode cuticle collagen N-terminal domain-containing protein n=1 Tax=Diploscapter pachys TaxID=2018661 RepID=A0A2A2K2T1_9BILA|nr:hypothetical protein WR25_19345 [Diploscapter pachys]
MYDEENSKAMIRTRRTINVRLRKDPYYTAPLEILDIPPSPIYEVPSTNSPYFTGEDGVPGFTPVLTEEGELTDGNLMYDYESNMLVKRQYSCVVCPAGPQAPMVYQELMDFRISVQSVQWVTEELKARKEKLVNLSVFQKFKINRLLQGIPGESAIMIVDLPGPKGLKGQIGAPGLMGLKGEDYVGYTIAPPGQVGVTGEAGKNGLDGAFGLQGPPGEQGIPGIDSGYCRQAKKNDEFPKRSKNKL